MIEHGRVHCMGKNYTFLENLPKKDHRVSRRKTSQLVMQGFALLFLEGMSVRGK